MKKMVTCLSLMAMAAFGQIIGPNLVKNAGFEDVDDNGGANRVIMESITEMCRRMGVHTLAEGIETDEQYRFLREIGCEMIQGFLFFRPEPLENLVVKPSPRGEGARRADEV